MSTPNERKEVFACFGAASYYANCVEVELVIARLFLARSDHDPSEAEWKEVEKERRTMGGLLKFVRAHGGIDADEYELLKKCVERRNYLAHNFWCERSGLLFTSDGCQQAVDELKKMCDLFKRGNEVAEQISVRLRKRAGIFEAVVKRLQVEFVERLKAEESQERILQGQEAWLERLRAPIDGLKMAKPGQGV